MGEYVPTVRSRRLAFELRRLRDESGMTYAEVAEALGWSSSKIYRIEHDRNRVIPRDVRRLLNLYEVPEGERRDAIMTLASGKDNGEGWWHRYGDVLPNWFQVYVSLESEAHMLQEYESELVPGLLQTEDYARAILTVDPVTETDEEIDRAVAARMARQDAVTREDSPVQLWVVLNEAVLRRQVGGAKVMQGQLEHLRHMSRRSNVAIQVVPFTAGTHPCMRNAFTLMTFSEMSDRRTVYVETQLSALYLEGRHEIELYAKRFDYLRAKAAGSEETLEWLTQVKAMM